MNSASSSLLLPRRVPSVLPGFGLTFGLSMSYLGLIVLIPLAGVFIRAAGLGWEQFWDLALDERTLDALCRTLLVLPGPVQPKSATVPKRLSTKNSTKNSTKKTAPPARKR